MAAVLLLATAGTGCREVAEPVPPPEPGRHVLTLDWNDGVRIYELYVPPGYDPQQPSPLVILLHGSPGSISQIRGTSGMEYLAAERGFLVAYPDDPQDAPLIRALVHHLIDVANVAPGRVYAAGFSAGGSASYGLAADSPELFAAIASVGGPYSGSATPAQTEVPVSVLTVVGSADQWQGRVERGLTSWHDRLGCTPGAPTWLDGEQRVSRTVATCQDGSESVAYRIDGLAHAWPVGPGQGLNATDTIWEFFDSHQRTG